jgi:predicted transcriptional regulator
MLDSYYLFYADLFRCPRSHPLFPLEERPLKFGNRTRVEILASILKVAGYGRIKTHIMYRANLSHKQLEKYIEFLEEKGLIKLVSREDGKGRMFQVTEKGYEFLREYSHISGYFEV